MSSRTLPASLSDMAPYYEALCKSLEWQMDAELLNKMKKANEEELKRLDNELEDAEKILGESEIRDAMMAKAEYLCRIGDKVGDTEALWTRRKHCMGTLLAGQVPVSAGRLAEHFLYGTAHTWLAERGGSY